VKKKEAREKPRSLGRQGEDFAAAYLEGQGLRILKRNFRTREGEIDVVAQAGEEIVFVEVKTRRSGGAGSPLEAMDDAKCQQLRRMAEIFLAGGDLPDSPVRFDVMAIQFDHERGRWKVSWIKRAF
jgi:putative endonuclease